MVASPQLHTNDNPLWQGPSGEGWNGGVTQSMIGKFLSCRERFRLKYILGLEPPDKWNHRLGYGQMWHVCEQALAIQDPSGVVVTTKDSWYGSLTFYAQQQAKLYPLQQEEIAKWYSVCCTQFPEYVKYWSTHPDVTNRTPLLQEQVFDVPYRLPSGRVVRLRGRWDSVDLIKDETEGKLGRHRSESEGIYLQENKTKGDIDKLQLERQLKFDLQTMLYLVTLCEYKNHLNSKPIAINDKVDCFGSPIKGVRYNVVRRPLSGGKGNISPHKEKATKTKYTPAETAEQFYERLRRDYFEKEPDYWFFRIRAEISERDIQVFRETCLDPILEQMCWWYEEVTNTNPKIAILWKPHRNYRTPFGIYNALQENGATEYDACLESGNESGLRRVTELFTELKDE